MYIKSVYNMTLQECIINHTMHSSRMNEMNLCMCTHMYVRTYQAEIAGRRVVGSEVGKLLCKPKEL